MTIITKQRHGRGVQLTTHKNKAPVVPRRLRKSSSKSSTSKPSTEKIDPHHQVYTLQQGQSEAFKVMIEGDGAEDDLEEGVWQVEPELEERANSISKKLEQARKDNEDHSWAKLSIYRIPHNLKDGEDKAYIPQIVSLGPYYHGKKRLSDMDQHKWRCLQCILKRTSHQIDLYLESVKDVEDRAYACYEGTISMSSPEFVEMMVLDGCFVIELFRGVQVGFETLGYHKDDPVFSMRGSMDTIQRDMIMLENQIPFFILDRLYGLQLGHPHLEEDLATLALRFFDHMRPTYETDNRRNRLELSDQGNLHCLALFRWNLVRQCSWKETKGKLQRQHQLIHCVTELREAGIKFSTSKTDKFWDIQFESGSLQIPQLVIHDGTRSLFLNLIAFEQRHVNCTNHITSYVIFMDNLINSPEDIRHLRDRGIIEHWLGSNTEVADLFNQLCQEVVFDINSSYLSAVSLKVKEYSNNRRHRWAFLLKHKYFNNPWSITSFIAALVLLLLTFTQTFYAVYSYHKLGS